MHNSPTHSPRRGRYRYLPVLSLLLVAAAGLLLVWNLLQRPTRRVAAFSAALQLVPKHFVHEVEERDLYESAMRGMVEGLKDPHSVYLDIYQVQQAAVQTRGEFGGIGVIIEGSPAGAVVLKVQQDGPAVEAGIKPGDLITAVDGKDCAGVPLTELVSRIRGKIGTSVELLLRRVATGETEPLRITRARITLENVSWETVEPGIGCIKVRQFDEKCVANVEKGLEALQGKDALKGLILDLRGNTGGLLQQAVGVSDLFLSEGVIASLQSRLSSERDTLEAHPQVAVSKDLPLAVLVDGGTASAAEVCAGSLQSQSRATLIGTATFGKGAVNRIFRLPDDSGLMLTVGHYTVGSGKVIEGKGIEPDIEVGRVAALPAGKGQKEVEEWLAAYRAAQEEQLQRAVQFIKEKIE